MRVRDALLKKKKGIRRKFVFHALVRTRSKQLLLFNVGKVAQEKEGIFLIIKGATGISTLSVACMYVPDEIRKVFR